MSALFLWRTPSPRAQAGPRFERFTREASLLLEALAIMAARCSWPTCASARTRGRGTWCWWSTAASRSRRGPGWVAMLERVRREARGGSRRSGATRVTVVASGDHAAHARRAAGGALPGARGARVLPALGATTTSMPALLWARAGGAGRRVHFFTDGAREGAVLPPAVRWRRRGAARDNVALVSRSAVTRARPPR